MLCKLFCLNNCYQLCSDAAVLSLRCHRKSRHSCFLVLFFIILNPNANCYRGHPNVRLHLKRSKNVFRVSEIYTLLHYNIFCSQKNEARAQENTQMKTSFFLLPLDSRNNAQTVLILFTTLFSTCKCFNKMRFH